MARLRSRSEYPPGQFCFTQPQTGWSAMPGSFDSVVRQVLSHRQGNKAITHQFSLNLEFEAIENEVDAFNAARCLASNWSNFVVEAPATPFPRPAMPFKKLSAGVAGGAIKKVVAGVKAVALWLGDGLKPVSQELAEQRAKTCAVRDNGLPCPMNGDPNFIERLSAIGAAEVKVMLAIKNDLALKTPYDDKLQTCTGCGCVLKTKIWTPLEHITATMSAEVRAGLDSKCWVLLEMKSEAAKLETAALK